MRVIRQERGADRAIDHVDVRASYSGLMANRYVIGVDIGGTKLLGGVVDPEFGVHQRLQRTTVGKDTTSLLDTMQEVVHELIHETDGEVVAVGFGVPSMMDQRTGTSVLAIHLPLAGVPVASVMGERLGLPVFVDNDGNNSMLAEHRAGVAAGTNHAVMLTIGTGIGGGMILNGQIYRGSVGSAAELGHMVIDLNGPPCQGNCPNHGCLEVLASGTALSREAARIADEHPESRLSSAQEAGRELVGALVTELAHDGDEAAIEAIELIGTRLGIGVANYVNIFNPEVFVIGGGVIAAGEMLLGPVRREVASRCLPPSRDVVRIVPAHFGTEAGMVGAAALAFEGLSRPDGLGVYL